jgi:hypothetical protein
MLAEVLFSRLLYSRRCKCLSLRGWSCKNVMHVSQRDRAWPAPLRNLTARFRYREVVSSSAENYNMLLADAADLKARNLLPPVPLLNVECHTRGSTALGTGDGTRLRGKGTFPISLWLGIRRRGVAPATPWLSCSPLECFMRPLLRSGAREIRIGVNRILVIQYLRVDGLGVLCG